MRNAPAAALPWPPPATAGGARPEEGAAAERARRTSSALAGGTASSLPHSSVDQTGALKQHVDGSEEGIGCMVKNRCRRISSNEGLQWRRVGTNKR